MADTTTRGGRSRVRRLSRPPGQGRTVPPANAGPAASPQARHHNQLAIAVGSQGGSAGSRDSRLVRSTAVDRDTIGEIRSAVRTGRPWRCAADQPLVFQFEGDPARAWLHDRSAGRPRARRVGDSDARDRACWQAGRSRLSGCGSPMPDGWRWSDVGVEPASCARRTSMRILKAAGWAPTGSVTAMASIVDLP
jgi:hypothetical protein